MKLKLYSTGNDANDESEPYLIFDNITKKILAEIVTKPKSATEISASTNIPLTTAYRRLHSLVEKKLVRISGSIVEGKKNFLYESKIKTIDSRFNAVEKFAGKYAK